MVCALQFRKKVMVTLKGKKCKKKFCSESRPATSFSAPTRTSGGNAQHTEDLKEITMPESTYSCAVCLLNSSTWSGYLVLKYSIMTFVRTSLGSSSNSS